MSQVVHPLDGYVRPGAIPHIWCAGCGNGNILSEFLRAVAELNYDLNKMVVVSGIGCIGRTSSYINTDGFHTTHGRPIPFAAGVKIARPEMKVVVISGDGDLFAIGGNHFVHAARRNIGITVICSNNLNYGMTGGQSGPTTPLGAYTPTTPYGNIEHPFNLAYLAASAGAVYVARWTSIHIKHLKNSIKKALQKDGFSFIEVISPCPEEYGRRNFMGTPVEQMRWLRKSSVTMDKIDPAEADVTPERIVVGEFVDVEKPEYVSLLRQKNQSVRSALDIEGKLTNAAL